MFRVGPFSSKVPDFEALTEVFGKMLPGSRALKELLSLRYRTSGLISGLKIP